MVRDNANCLLNSIKIDLDILIPHMENTLWPLQRGGKRGGEEREERRRNEEGIEKNVATVDDGDRSPLQFIYIYLLASHFSAH